MQNWACTLLTKPSNQMCGIIHYICVHMCIFIYTLKKTNVDRERQNKGHKERWISESGVPWVISNSFHWKIFLMITLKSAEQRLSCFFHRVILKCANRSKGEKCIFLYFYLQWNSVKVWHLLCIAVLLQLTTTNVRRPNQSKVFIFFQC